MEKLSKNETRSNENEFRDAFAAANSSIRGFQRDATKCLSIFLLNAFFRSLLRFKVILKFASKFKGVFIQNIAKTQSTTFDSVDKDQQKKRLSRN